MNQTTACDYSIITERPGDRAHREQMSALLTRYHFAASRCDGQAVLELGCGAGIGLSYLAARAKTVCGADIDPRNIGAAKANNAGIPNVAVRQFDALRSPFPPGSFEVVIAFECLYYFEDPGQLLRVVRELLQPGGQLLISSVNREWHGFNPSPFSRRYLGLHELADLLAKCGFRAEFYRGFCDGADTPARRTVRAIRRTAVALHLIPRSMKGKAWLKRLFYGRLDALPQRLMDGCAPLEPLERIQLDATMANHKFIYAAAQRA